MMLPETKEAAVPSSKMTRTLTCLRCLLVPEPAHQTMCSKLTNSQGNISCPHNLSNKRNQPNAFIQFSRAISDLRHSYSYLARY